MDTINLPQKPDNSELIKLINSRIESLRPKLLDLTRRNPLLSTKFSDRSHSHIRVVDEMPEVLLSQLSEKAMRLVPLPALEDDPKDEQGRTFQNALSNARLTDEKYKKTLDAIDQDADDADEKLAKAERDLKDTLRVQLGMAPRQTRASLSITQHAKNHDILPSYDLPLVKEKNRDGRHQDENIQTLLIPDMLERRLNALTTKCRTWVEETGIDVLQAAFGFLEWTEQEGSDPTFAPLLLLPVQIEKKRTKQGYEFWVQGSGDLPEINIVLVEKLRLDFGIKLPDYNEESSLEKYFDQVNLLTPRGMKWKVRRQVAIGVFPSARMAMYHDLNTQSWDFAKHNVIKTLFGAAERVTTASMFGDEYQIDDPEIECKVPALVTDADSSQFSAIVDVADGKNIAVEGPPGTGKSQTIVNTIASLLFQGKRVLFVAEKMAALEVVRSRLEACGLGAFLLTLQATRSSKEQIIQSLRDRIGMRSEGDAGGLDESIEQFKNTRTKIHSYLSALSSIFGRTKMSVHEILGWSISSRNIAAELPDEILKTSIPDVSALDVEAIKEICSLCDLLEHSWKETLAGENYWRKIGRSNLDPFSADEILKIAKDCSKDFQNSADKRELLPPLGINQIIEVAELTKILNVLEFISSNNPLIDPGLLLRLTASSALNEVKDYLSSVESVLRSKEAAAKLVHDPLGADLPDKLAQLSSALDVLGLKRALSIDAVKAIASLQEEIVALDQAIAVLQGIIKVVPVGKDLISDALITMCDIATQVSRPVLAIRNTVIENPEAAMFIAKSKKTCADLLVRREKLTAVFNLNSLPTDNEISTAATIIGTVGIFDIFIPKYHQAKKFYKAISKTQKYQRKIAALELTELLRWVQENRNYSTDNKSKELMGNHFDGLDTNFSPFEDLLSFYDSVAEKLAGVANQEIREFLRTESIELIKALPALDLLNPIRRIGTNLNEVLIKKKKALETLATSEQALEAVKKYSAVLIDPLNSSSSIIKEIVPEIKRIQKKCFELNENKVIRKLLDSYFKGIETNSKDIETTIQATGLVLGLTDENRKIALRAIKDNKVDDFINVLVGVIKSDEIAEASLHRLASLLEIDPYVFKREMSRKVFSAFLEKAANDKDGLILNSKLAASKRDLASKNFGYLINAIESTKSSLQGLSTIVKAVIAQAMARAVYKEHGNILANFNGSKLDKLRTKLADLDRTIIELSRKRVRYHLRKYADPPEGSREGRRGEWTDMCLIENEVSKKSRYVPVRDLTKRAGRALLELKPCWMMSPLAVAQYIPKGMIEFDLVIIDEASQMTPEDAVGALIRSKQSMVVGDTNQLPPTTFFQKYIETDEDDEDDSVSQESILEMANAVFRPARRLKWHYRSKHPGLIAFSNKFVYDSDLVIFPSPFEHQLDMGVSYRKVNGFYANGTNPIEAKEMVDAAIQFIHKHKDRSLGIVVLNQKQKDLVEQEWEFALKNDHQAQAYIEHWNKYHDGLEKLFIKNLENVQGDERDVIFIGTVYGPEKEGAPVMQRFGPITGITGKRRLNVLFTRAKKCIVTFSSMTSADIRGEEGKNEGVFLFKKWLEYSSTGRILLDKIENERKPGSLFEEHVIQQLKAIGCEIVPQVGVSGYFIDIGVRHPNWQHGFIMGVECDGATYHSSISARDRDRLRQEVLVGLGWHLHRIWSTDWFDNPIKESERLRGVIQERLRVLQNNRP